MLVTKFAKISTSNIIFKFFKFVFFIKLHPATTGKLFEYLKASAQSDIFLVYVMLAR